MILVLSTVQFSLRSIASLMQSSVAFQLLLAHRQLRFGATKRANRVFRGSGNFKRRLQENLMDETSGGVYDGEGNLIDTEATPPPKVIQPQKKEEEP